MPDALRAALPAVLLAALPVGLLVAGGALLARLGRSAASARAVALLSPAFALAVLALGPARPGAPGALRALEATLVAAALGSMVLGRETGAAARSLAPLLLGAAGLLVVAGATGAGAAALGFALGVGPIVWLLRGADAPAGGRYLGASLLAGGLLVVGLGLLVATAASAGLDLMALPVVEGQALRRATRGAALGVVLVCLALTHLLAAPPVGPTWSPALGEAAPPLALWLAACAPCAAAAFGLRVTGGLRLEGGGLVLAGVDPGVVIGAAGALAILAARLATRRAVDLGRLLLRQAAATGGWVLLGLGALASPRPLEAALATRGVAALAVSALVAQGALAALLACADRELGGRGLERWVGAARRNRWLAGALVLATASAAGAAPTLGFVARLHVLGAVVEGGYGPLAVVGALDLALGLALTLRVARVALLAQPPRPAHGPDAVEPLVTTPGLTVLAVVLAALGLALGLVPAGLLRALG